MRPATAPTWFVLPLAGCGGGPATMGGDLIAQRLVEAAARRVATAWLENLE